MFRDHCDIGVREKIRKNEVTMRGKKASINGIAIKQSMILYGRRASKEDIVGKR